MDNEAPKYAEWIPEAGGYVANGQVVSRTPQYDANGRLVAVDVSQFATPTTAKNQPQVANQTINNGVTTANTAGSNIDVNSMATKAGSLVSLNLNTENPNESAISSPATKSPIAGQVILTPQDEVNKEYQDAVARNDIQGQINALTKASRLTGVDYSAEIANLTSQRQQKIQGIDDNYLQRLNEAQQKVNNAKAMYDLSGKEADKEAYLNALAEYNAIQSEQTKWRAAVGYDDAMKSMYQAEMDAIDIDFQDTWRNAIDDISNQIIQAYPAILNFQYDPMQDGNLMRAQSMVEARMRNSMSQTGMYYSSTTQYAIAQAIGELIPVYEKMAREEIIENFKLLQSTASFLMDLEATQFNMWKSQIQMKWDAANQKQKEIQNAINNANARGYYTNEEAAKVGVAPGTESQAARERALDKQEQIEAELRNLQQSEALAEFKDKLDRETYEEQLKIRKKYETPNTSPSDTPGTTDNETTEEAEETGFDWDKLNWELEKLPGTMTASSMKNELQQTGSNYDLTDADKLILLGNMIVQGKSWDAVWEAISQAEYENGARIYNNELISKLQGTPAEKLRELSRYYRTISSNSEAADVLAEFKQLAKEGKITNTSKRLFANAYIKDGMLNDIELTSDIDRNEDNIAIAFARINNSLNYLEKDETIAAYKALFDVIDSSGTKNNPFRYNKADVKTGNILSFWGKDFYDASLNGWGDKSKENAMLDILENLKGTSAQILVDKTIVDELIKDFKTRVATHKNGYGTLKKDKYYSN